MREEFEVGPFFDDTWVFEKCNYLEVNVLKIAAKVGIEGEALLFRAWHILLQSWIRLIPSEFKHFVRSSAHTTQLETTNMAWPIRRHH